MKCWHWIFSLPTLQVVNGNEMLVMVFLSSNATNYLCIWNVGTETSHVQPYELSMAITLRIICVYEMLALNFLTSNPTSCQWQWNVSNDFSLFQRYELSVSLKCLHWLFSRPTLRVVNCNGILEMIFLSSNATNYLCLWNFGTEFSLVQCYELYMVINCRQWIFFHLIQPVA